MKEEIEQLLKENGETGVNAIAAGINRPVSSVQKYLEKQNYFVKTIARKWDLPERVMERALSDFESKSHELALKEGKIAIERTVIELDLMKAKLSEVAPLIEKLEKLNSLPTIKYAPPVANPPIVKKVIDNAEQMRITVKAHLDKVPSEYKDLLSNLDYLKLTLRKGIDFVENEMLPELTALIMGEETELEESTIALFESYQTGQKKPEKSVSDVETTS